eukprot:c19708_g1_i1.p1 GENE.c19708_g1_i1~~c19708_g1_i1.p1  ORF type:complete len:395 (+),score=96.98 c19708_g1_i1:41-1225(+)
MAEGVEQALVQRLLRGTEVCSLAASARLKNEDGKTVPIIIALVSSRESPHELSLFVIKVASGVFGRSALYKCFAVNTDLGIEKNSTNSTLTVAFNQEFLVFEGISADIQEQIDASCQASVAALIAMRSPTGTMEHAWLKCYADEQLDKSEMDMAGDSPGQLDVPLAGIRNPSNFSSFRVNAVNRLLKQRKAEFSTSTRITVHVCTWNVNAKFPDEDITPWLQATMEPQPEVIAVGLQEMVELNTQNLILTDNTRAMEWQMHLNKILNSGPHVHSVVQAITMFLGSLEKPVVAERLYKDAVAHSENAIAANQVVSELDPVHSSVLVYLFSFLREMVARHADVTPDLVAGLFAGVLMRAPGEGPSAQASSNVPDLKRRAQFLKHLLVDEDYTLGGS